MSGFVKVDTASVNPRLKGNETWGGEQYFVDGTAAYHPSQCHVVPDMVWSKEIVHCDNTGAVMVANSGYSRAPQIMHLLQCLFFIRARFGFSLQAVHIEGTDNTLADAVSRNNHLFLDSQVFQSTYQCTPLPEELVLLLVVQQADWTSDRCTQRFMNCLQPA